MAKNRSSAQAGSNAAKRMGVGIAIGIVIAVIVVAVGIRWMPF